MTWLSLLIFIVSYSLLTVIFALLFRGKVQEPLKQLNQAISNLTDQTNQVVLDYQGPIEFTSIADNFNRVSRNLRQSQLRQQELQAEKQKMLADISHDLKTPITVIQGYTKAIKDGKVPKEEQAQYLQTIYQKTEKLTSLIDSFYQFSKIEHPDFELDRKQTDLAEFIRHYLAQHYAEFEISGYHLDATIPETRISYAFDQAQFSRVLDNLFANFFKYNPPTSTLYLTLEEQNHTITLVVADDGSGISQEVSNQLFQPFVTGDNSRSNQAGTGLGLAIAQQIITKHGGSIHLQQPPSPPYKTAFIIQLPKPPTHL